MDTPAILYYGSASYQTPIRPELDKAGLPIPTQAYVDREKAITEALMELMRVRWAVKKIEILWGTEWVVTLDVTSGPMTKVMLAMALIYVHVIVPIREHQWVYNAEAGAWETVKKISFSRRCERVSVNEWLQERKLTIKHPRYR